MGLVSVWIAYTAGARFQTLLGPLSPAELDDLVRGSLRYVDCSTLNGERLHRIVMPGGLRLQLLSMLSSSCLLYTSPSPRDRG
eukprot:4412344-Amphidinium_carterae.4